MCQMFIHMSLESKVAQISINSQNSKEGNLPKLIELITFFYNLKLKTIYKH